MKKILLALALALVLVLACAAVASAVSVDLNAVVAYGDLDSITSVGGHPVKAFDWTYYAKTQPATCTERGIAWYYCDDPNCENGLHSVIVEARGHVPMYDTENKATYIPPTCTTPGSADQVCSRCGVKIATVEIKPNGHTFSGTKYKVIFGATCTNIGYGVICCDVCGELKALPPKDMAEAASVTYTWDADKGMYVNEEKSWVQLQKIAHNFTDWKYNRTATCYEPGIATRTCIVCGFVQYVDYLTDLYVDPNGNIVPEGTKDAILLKAQAGQIDALNYYYSTQSVYTPDDETCVAEAMGGKTYENRQELQKDIDKWVKVAHFVVDSDEEWDCDTRIITFKCPYCDSKSKAMPADWAYLYAYGYTGGTANYCPHPKFSVFVLEPSHIWKEQKEMPIQTWELTYKYIADFQADYPTADVNEYVRCLALSYWLNDGVLRSIPATCEMPGIDLYRCIYFYDIGMGANHGKVMTLNGTDYVDGLKTVLVPATGHDWSEWKTAETYTKDGKNFKVEDRVCNVCGKPEHRTIEYDPSVNYRQGLTPAGDDWAYYVDDKLQKDYSGFVAFEGGQFYVIDGVVAKDLNGLVNCPGDKWYFMAQGQVQKDATFAQYDGKIFKLVNGELDKDANGLYEYDGQLCAFAVGRFAFEANGLWQNPQDGKWYFLAEGRVQKVTQEVTYNGETFNVVDGVLAE